MDLSKNIKYDSTLKGYYDNNLPSDKACVKDCYKDYIDLSNDLFENKIVVDFGSNIGLFSVIASDKGATKVYSYEMINDCVLFSKKYNARPNIEYNCKCVVCNDLKTVDYKMRNYSMSATINYKRVTKLDNIYSVEAENIYEILENKNCQLLKIDIEGEEHNIDFEKLHSIENLKNIIIEIHYLRGHKHTDDFEIVNDEIVIKPNSYLEKVTDNYNIITKTINISNTFVKNQVTGLNLLLERKE